MNQFNIGVILKIINIIIDILKAALKLFVLMFLFKYTHAPEELASVANGCLTDVGLLFVQECV